jgi:hypothetical protein
MLVLTPAVGVALALPFPASVSLAQTLLPVLPSLSVLALAVRSRRSVIGQVADRRVLAVRAWQ